MNMQTTIQVKKDTLERLKFFKETTKESYDEIINKVLDEIEEGELTEETIEDIRTQRRTYRKSCSRIRGKVMKIIILPTAKKGLKKLSPDDISIILKKLYGIKDNPLRYIERLKSSHLWKLRIGEYRAIMIINTKDKIINVIKIGHRKNIYKKL
jgi:mRNA interferase RelE/StbE